MIWKLNLEYTAIKKSVKRANLPEMTQTEGSECRLCTGPLQIYASSLGFSFSEVDVEMKIIRILEMHWLWVLVWYLNSECIGG